MIPRDGFVIVAAPYLAVVSLILYDTSLPWSSRAPMETPCGIVWRRDNRTFEEVEVNYADLFEKFADALIKNWPRWIEWRKRRRRKPEPEWLRALKEEERKRKA